jgi:Cu(I)/Ag(I) efflux system membrane fusion protein
LVTLDHAPIETMRWPAMRMEFEVADKKMLDHLKPGSKVQFQFTDKGKGKYLITDLTS